MPENFEAQELGLSRNPSPSGNREKQELIREEGILPAPTPESSEDD